MKTGIVFDIKEFAVFDGPGIRTTVFMKGCPLRYTWCHNPEGLSPEPQLMVSTAACTHCGAYRAVCPSPDRCTACGKCIPACRGGFRKISGQRFTSEELAKRLIKDRDVYEMSGGGVTFSGGEPLMQWEFVSEVFARLGGVHKAIETSGFSADGVFSSAMRETDLIMLDWKVSDPALHKKYTGASQEPIRRHAEMLALGSTPFILRLPIIPEVNDKRAHFEAAAELVAHAKALVRVEILPYQPAAGAKYAMVGREYRPGFDEKKPLKYFTEVFDERNIPYRIFK